jgi:DNA replication protein DnaC
MPIDRKETHLFFQFVCWRYEKSSIIMTSNKSFSEWEEVFGDPVIATAILDRLLHHCHVAACCNLNKSSSLSNKRALSPFSPNKSFSEWEEVFGDQVIATAILDRLLHHCHMAACCNLNKSSSPVK